MVINCRPRISKSNSESKGQTFLDFQACFKVDDGCDFMNCVICWCSCSIMILVSMWISQYWSCCSTWDKWIIYSWNYDIVVWSWWCTSDCDCCVWLGMRLPHFSKLTWIGLPRSDINIGSRFPHSGISIRSDCHIPASKLGSGTTVVQYYFGFGFRERTD